MLCKVTHCAGHVSANTRPHQLCWGDWEMGTSVSCTEWSQMAGLVQWVGHVIRLDHSCYHLKYMQLGYYCGGGLGT